MTEEEAKDRWLLRSWRHAMNPAISFSPLCPDCAHEMIECNGKWICLNGECESIELKAPLVNGEIAHTRTATQGGDTDEKMQRVSGGALLGGNNNNTIRDGDRDHQRGEETPPSSYDLKAPDNCSAEIDQGSVVDRGAVTMPQDKESMALVRQKGDFSAEN